MKKFLDFKVAMKTVKSNAVWFLLWAFFFIAASAPTYRLRNIEKAPNSGYSITSGANGVAQWTQSGNGEVNVNNTPVAFVPPATGNTTNLNETVIDPGGNVWLIDANGDAIRIERASSSIPEADDIYYDDVDSGLGNNVSIALDSLARRATSSGGGGSGTTQYKIAGQNILFAGDAGTGNVTASVTAAGELAFNIPAGVVHFSLTVPRSVAGVAADNSFTSTFTFAVPGPFNQSEETMRYPDVNIFSRATEATNGFDVEMTGNNPQKRLLPFATAGQCRHQVGGISSAGSNWTITYRF